MPARKHRVVEGEVMAKIAARYGFRDWATIWEDAANDSIRNDRPNPNILHPGDVVMIPEKQEKQEPCSTGSNHVFQVPVMKQKLRIVVEDVGGEPMANKPYTLTIEGTKIDGTTAADGLIDEEIDIRAEEGKLEIEGNVWQLQIGFLHPVVENTSDMGVSGAQARLNNLGYSCPTDGHLDEETRSALRAFQVDEGLTENGELDADTRTRLRDKHGC